MKNVEQLFLGLLTAVASSVLVLAAASLALVEGGGPGWLGSINTPEIPINTPATGVTLPPLSLPTATQAPVQATTCPTPAGWTAYSVQSWDSLESLAQMANTTSEEIFQMNCLESQQLVQDTILYLPLTLPTATVLVLYPTVAATATITPTATITLTTVVCGPPSGWILYTVKPGENLYRLSLAFGVSVQQLMFANCLTSDRINAGQQLYVPNVPTRVPSPTTAPTNTPKPPQEPTATLTPVPTQPPPEPTTPVPAMTEAPTVEPTIEITPVTTEPPSKPTPDETQTN
jgi:LysM repeat protein